ncbi:MAG: hypothetical protein ACRD4Y_15285, partial [Candidatus Acidiferrales bacterium]
RGLPMMVINRSSLPVRSFLIFLFVLFGTPVTARCDSLEDSARALAQKIAAGLTVPAAISLSLRNSSSLTSEDAGRITQALESELMTRNVRVQPDDAAMIHVAVTLSESFEDYVWTAEIRQGDATDVAITEFPRSEAGHLPSIAPLAILRSERIWEGTPRVIDVHFEPATSIERRMVLLVPDGLISTNTAAGAASQILNFPPALPIEREPTGKLLQSGDRIEASLNGRVCTVVLDTGTVEECHAAAPMADLAAQISSVSEKPDFGDQVRELPGMCGMGNAILATADGDYTQPDSVQIFRGQTPVSNDLKFPGPVLRFSVGPDAQSVIAIVRNLKDRNYELYRISISCEQ